jgi:hypothetical protein
LQDNANRGLQDNANRGLQDNANRGLQDNANRGLQDNANRGLQDNANGVCQLQPRVVSTLGISALGCRNAEGVGYPLKQADRSFQSDLSN